MLKNAGEYIICVHKAGKTRVGFINLKIKEIQECNMKAKPILADFFPNRPLYLATRIIVAGVKAWNS